jgi:hypothetical protein
MCKIKCIECSKSIPDVPEDASYEELLCDQCYMNVSESDRLLDKLYNSAMTDREGNSIEQLATQLLTVRGMLTEIIDEPATQLRYGKQILKIYADRLVELLS